MPRIAGIYAYAKYVKQLKFIIGFSKKKGLIRVIKR